ncbi:MAG TPA: hypothetical protein DCG47_04925 [Spirochaetaceae bacterium]|jgi:hypothetical protein|nr:hypothetical protein [Spirochaetaceae bacterium]
MNRKSIALLALLAVVLVAGAFAQSRGTLTVTVSEGPAQIILGGRLLGVANPRFSGLVNTGTYELIVRKSGLPEFKQMISISTAGLTLTVQLGSAAVTPPPTVTPPPVVNHNVTINANVANAEVYLNNVLAGRTPFTGQLPNGSYTLVIKAPGFLDYTQNLSVSGSMTVNATLQGITVPLNLGRLLPGAEIFLNGVSYGKAGNNPFTVQIAPGTYTLTIRLAGYMDLSMQITVGGGGTTLTPTLQPIMANYSFEIPESVLNPDMRGNPWSQIRLFIDGVAQKDFKGQVQAGKRVIKMVTGAFQIQMEFVFEAGKTYTFQPFAGLNVLQ